jgi:pimeloyl-ACP methyl ester carboxylesterase
MPGAELVLLPGQAHVPMLEQPEAFAELVCNFLDRIGH